MPNTNFVPNWTFERTLPSPFDSYSGKSAVMKDIASKYCNQPKKRATLHSATLQAVFSYMDLENPPAGKAEEELGAIGSQANNFTIRISKPYRVAACSGLQPYDWEIYSRKV